MIAKWLLELLLNFDKKFFKIRHSKSQFKGTLLSKFVICILEPQKIYFFPGIDNDHDSDLNSSIGRLSQEAFAKLQPRAKSSPKPSENDSHAHEANDVSFLERKT